MKPDNLRATTKNNPFRNVIKQRGRGFTDVFFSFTKHTRKNAHKTFDPIPEPAASLSPHQTSSALSMSATFRFVSVVLKMRCVFFASIQSAFSNMLYEV